jgi:hypothetical protein
MKFLGLIIGTGLILCLAACSHNPNKAEKIDTAMKSEGTVTGETVGIKDGNMVIQRKTLLTEELRDIQYEVYGLEEQVYGNEAFKTLGLYGVLKDCRLQLTDKHNGGDGKLIWTEPLDRVTSKEEEFKIGVDEHDKLVAVSEEFIKDRIARFREYKSLLTKRQTEYQQKVDICTAELNSRKYDQGHHAANNSGSGSSGTTATAEAYPKN